MIETITTLWPEPDEVDGLVFHKYLRRPWSVEPWQERTLELLGYGGVPIHVVAGARPVGVEQLLVPSRAVVPDGWAHPQAREVWSRISRQFRDPSSPEKVFLSRTRFSDELRRSSEARMPRTEADRDRALDTLFARQGFDVVYPEELPLDDQFTVFSNARLLAGCSGSALHMSAFAPNGAHVLEIGDSRSDEPMRMQAVIDAVCGHHTRFVAEHTPIETLASELPEFRLEESGTQDSASH